MRKRKKQKEVKTRKYYIILVFLIILLYLPLLFDSFLIFYSLILVISFLLLLLLVYGLITKDKEKIPFGVGILVISIILNLISIPAHFLIMYKLISLETAFYYLLSSGFFLFILGIILPIVVIYGLLNLKKWVWYLVMFFLTINLVFGILYSIFTGKIGVTLPQQMEITSTLIKIFWINKIVIFGFYFTAIILLIKKRNLFGIKYLKKKKLKKK